MGRTVRLPLELPGRPVTSEVWVGDDVLDPGPPELRKAVEPWLAGRRLFVVTSPRIRELHGERLESLGRAASAVTWLTVPEGEEAKSIAEADRLWQAMLETGGKRDSRLITFGGGSVGDLGGFVAACFLRGIEYAQVPTTLLAQVDASIGGKTAVDVPQGKNLVGAFLQPRFVLSDTRLLATLPPAELRAGLAEAVKKGAVLGEGKLFEEIESRLDDLLRGDAAALASVVAGAARLKLEVVAGDEREGGLRKVLNFGHTLAHALEQQLGYAGLRHGEAVSYGMLFALRLAVVRGKIHDDLPGRLAAVLRRFDLPPLPVHALRLEGLTAAMGRDKKASEKGLTWVLPTGLGGFAFDSEVDPDDVERELAAFLRDPWAVGG